MHSLSGAIWRSRWLALAACSLGLAGCLGDSPSTIVNSLQGQGGNAGGSAGGDAGSGGRAGAGTVSNTAGDAGASGSGGSASTTGGSAGDDGSAGSAGSGGEADEPDAGGGAAEPDAGEPVEPEEPEDEAVVFSDVFPLLVTECGGCHGANAPGARPRFAIAGNEAASYAATQLMSQQQLVSARIVLRTVTARTMPPGCNGGALGTGSCVSQDQADLLEQWLEDGALP